jgi:hypothetical protein
MLPDSHERGRECKSTVITYVAEKRPTWGLGQSRSYESKSGWVISAIEQRRGRRPQGRRISGFEQSPSPALGIRGITLGKLLKNIIQICAFQCHFAVVPYPSAR